MRRSPDTGRGLPRLLAAAGLAVVLASPTGCGPSAAEPVRVDRDALGTVVSVTAYGPDEAAVRSAVASAYAEMAAVEGSLDAWDESSAIAELNRGWQQAPSRPQPLPDDVFTVLDATEALGVTDSFSPALWGASKLYDFEGVQSVPTTEAARWASSWRFTAEPDRGIGWFGGGSPPPPTMLAHPPGLDFGGATKGLALDRAAALLRTSGAVDAALVTAGSTTITFGEKPRGEAWRIGIEDPREPGRVVAVVEATGTVTVSTSGDYQQHFERDGVNWHHILDPATGRPVRGMRSLTVIGASDGLSSDILSTALFVMGTAKAAAYARERSLGLYVVDERGVIATVGPPPGARWRIVEQSEPRK